MASAKPLSVLEESYLAQGRSLGGAYRIDLSNLAILDRNNEHNVAAVALSGTPVGTVGKLGTHKRGGLVGLVLDAVS